MSFIISGLPSTSFTPLFSLDDATLARRGAIRSIADRAPGYPCRITLEDARAGESVLLLNFVHQRARTPFHSSHAIYVRERALATASFVDAVPAALRIRVLSVRAFDTAGMMLDADLVDGVHLDTVISRLFGAAEVAYLHVHYAKPGCYAARIDRLAT